MGIEAAFEVRRERVLCEIHELINELKNGEEGGENMLHVPSVEELSQILLSAEDGEFSETDFPDPLPIDVEEKVHADFIQEILAESKQKISEDKKAFEHRKIKR